jgi:hydroxyacylglutathione hydrolase
MSLCVENFVLGSIDNNTYLLWDETTQQAVVIDPSFNPAAVINAIKKNNLNLTGIWLTHGHFDHFFGIPDMVASHSQSIPLLIHPKDAVIYQAGGLAPRFGVKAPDFPEPAGFFSDGQILMIGDAQVQVRHTPGHSAGHVIFYAEEIATAFTGDLIFRQSVGRTDLPGGDQDALLKSIYTQVLTLPGETILMPGHGDKTSVEEEVEYNPYLN